MVDIIRIERVLGVAYAVMVGVRAGVIAPVVAHVIREQIAIVEVLLWYSGVPIVQASTVYLRILRVVIDQVRPNDITVCIVQADPGLLVANRIINYAVTASAG